MNHTAIPTDIETSALRITALSKYRTELHVAVLLGITQLRQALRRVPARHRAGGWRLALFGNAPAHAPRHTPTVAAESVAPPAELSTKTREALSAVQAAAVHLDGLLKVRRLYAALIEAELGRIADCSPAVLRDHRDDELDDAALLAFGTDGDNDEVDEDAIDALRAEVEGISRAWADAVYALAWPSDMHDGVQAPGQQTDNSVGGPAVSGH